MFRSCTTRTIAAEAGARASSAGTAVPQPPRAKAQALVMPRVNVAPTHPCLMAGRLTRWKVAVGLVGIALGAAMAVAVAEAQLP